MRSMALAFAMACAASTGLALDSDPVQLVRELDAAFDRGIRAHDFDALAAIYTPEALYVQDDGPIRRGRSEIRRQWISDVEEFGLRSMRLEPIRVERQDDLILEVGNGESELAARSGEEPTRYRFKYVNVWRWVPHAGWRLEIDSYCGLLYESGSETDQRILGAR